MPYFMVWRHYNNGRSSSKRWTHLFVLSSVINTSIICSHTTPNLTLLFHSHSIIELWKKIIFLINLFVFIISLIIDIHSWIFRRTTFNAQYLRTLIRLIVLKISIDSLIFLCTRRANVRTQTRIRRTWMFDSIVTQFNHTRMRYKLDCYFENKPRTQTARTTRAFSENSWGRSCLRVCVKQHFIHHR